MIQEHIHNESEVVSNTKDSKVSTEKKKLLNSAIDPTMDTEVLLTKLEYEFQLEMRKADLEEKRLQLQQEEKGTREKQEKESERKELHWDLMQAIKDTLEFFEVRNNETTFDQEDALQWKELFQNLMSRLEKHCFLNAVDHEKLAFHDCISELYKKFNIVHLNLSLKNLSFEEEYDEDEDEDEETEEAIYEYSFDSSLRRKAEKLTNANFLEPKSLW